MGRYTLAYVCTHSGDNMLHLTSKVCHFGRVEINHAVRGTSSSGIQVVFAYDAQALNWKAICADMALG